MDSRETLRIVQMTTNLPTNQLANIMGMHRETLARYIHGQQRTPRHVALAALAIALNCGVAVQFDRPAEQLAVAAKRARIT